MSDLSELFEQLADGPVLLATAFDSVDADYDTALPFRAVVFGDRAELGVALWPRR